VFVDLLLILIIRALQQSLRILPESVQLFKGKMLGRLAFLALRSRRQVAITNIKRVFPLLSDREITSIAKRNFEKLGINVIELLLVSYLSRTEITKRFDVEGLEHFEEALNKGKGVIALTFHFANWEVEGIASRLLNRDVIALARPLKKHRLLNNFLNRLRESAGLTIMVNENVAQEVIRLLKENKVVVILGDQREKRSRGVFVDFFGVKVSTSKGMAMIGMKTGASVLPVYPVRKGFLRYTYVCGAPIEMERGGNIEDLVAKNTRKINAFLETIILKYPDEWFWVHRRWGRREKSTE